MKKTLTAAAVCAVMAPVGVTFAETSVSVGGYARTGFNYFLPDEGDDDDTSNFTYRGRFQVDAKNDSGVRATLRLQGSGDTSDANVGVDRALLRYAGFRFGYSDSFQTTFHGYGNPIERQDGNYGFDQASFIDYTGKFAGFSYGIGVQDTDQRNAGNNDIDFYIGSGFDFAGASFKVSYLHDTNAEDGQFKITANYSIAGFSINAGIRDQTGPNRYSQGFSAAVAGGVGVIPADEQLGTPEEIGILEAAPAVLGDVASWWVGARYAINDNIAVGLGATGDDNDDSEEFAATLFWAVAPDLSFRPEIHIADAGTNLGFRLYRTF